MSQLMESGAEMSEELDRQSEIWKAGPELEPSKQTETPTLNARAVEFIAKPGKAWELQECLRGGVMESLKKRAGFSGAIVMTSHKESRLIVVISFWTTVRAATENHWEDSRVVRQTVSPLIDVCARVHTYEAAIPTTRKTQVHMVDLHVC
jgi:quinol monooxygenase YgiN